MVVGLVGFIRLGGRVVLGRGGVAGKGAGGGLLTAGRNALQSPAVVGRSCWKLLVVGCDTVGAHCALQHHQK